MARPPKPPAPGMSVSIGGQEVTATSQAGADRVLGRSDRNYVITEAKVKDAYCHYSFEITEGVEAGAEHAVKIDNEVTRDLQAAFEKFHVHLAVIDDVFKHAGIELSDIDRYHGDTLTMLYFVTGFKMYGEPGDESVILMGSKHVSSAGRIDIKTPKIPLDPNSSYKWYNELAAAVLDARNEVSLYKEGKFIQKVAEAEQPNPKQMKISDMMEQDIASGIFGKVDTDVDFESARA